MQTNLDLRNTILPENKPNSPVSYGCKFPLVFSLPVSSNVRCRVLYRRTIGAGTSVRLGFPNARPVVSDERSEEFRRAVKESLNGPFQANRSDGIKPGIGIERKKKLNLLFFSYSGYKSTINTYFLDNMKPKSAGINYLFS